MQLLNETQPPGGRACRASRSQTSCGSLVRRTTPSVPTSSASSITCASAALPATARRHAPNACVRATAFSAGMICTAGQSNQTACSLLHGGRNAMSGSPRSCIGARTCQSVAFMTMISFASVPPRSSSSNNLDMCCADEIVNSLPISWPLASVRLPQGPELMELKRAMPDHCCCRWEDSSSNKHVLVHPLSSAVVRHSCRFKAGVLNEDAMDKATDSL